MTARLLVNKGAKGFLACVIQHKIDHLNGKLCLDGVKEIAKIDREKYIPERIKQGALAQQEIDQTQSAQAG